MKRSCAVLAVTAATVGCGDDPGLSLLVDVRTDLTPAVDFAAVEVEVRGAGGDRQTSAPALAAHDFLTGRRVAELDGLASGDLDVHVALVDSTGATVAVRTTELLLTGDTGLVVVISRDCVGVRCPGTADAPTRTQCHGGACVDPRCHPGRLDACGALECTSDEACSAGDACGAGACVSGACLFRAATCNADAGSGDAGMLDAGAADAGLDASAPPDAPGACTEDNECPPAEVCAAGTCEPECSEVPFEPYSGMDTPCSADTRACLEACGDAACRQGCFDADPNPSCYECYFRKLVSCTNAAGCQSEWNCYAWCVVTSCPEMDPACVSANCSDEAMTWSVCASIHEMTCSAVTGSCFP